MTTYRERREARAERLRGWADSREAKAQTAYERADSIASQIPFGQPILVGHHSEGRARRDQDRIWNGMRRSVEHADKAASMRSKADNIDAAAARAIYSDDDNAAEALEARISKLEAERDRIKAFNAAVRKAKQVTSDALDLLDAKQRADYLGTAERCAYILGPCGTMPAYHLSNLGGNITRNRKRLEQLRRKANR